jgi:hypothetical protein
VEANGTYLLVDPPPGAHVLGNTVQFRIKTGPDGEVIQYKARICARGDKQVFMIDYIETRAPVADLVCVRIFFILACKYKMTIRQGDMPAAYLKATLKKTVYMRQVKGFEIPGQGVAPSKRFLRSQTSWSRMESRGRCVSEGLRPHCDKR